MKKKKENKIPPRASWEKPTTRFYHAFPVKIRKTKTTKNPTTCFREKSRHVLPGKNPPCASGAMLPPVAGELYSCDVTSGRQS